MAQSKNNGKQNAGVSLGIKLTLIAVALLCVAALVYGILNTTGVIARNTTAMTVGEETISTLEMRQYYANTRSSFMSQYGDMLAQYGYDVSSAAFDAQPSLFDSSSTWKEYFLSSAQASARETSILTQEAAKAGYTLTESDRQSVADYMASLNSMAETGGYKPEEYVRRLYGKNVTLSDAEAFFTKRTLANSFYQHIVDGLGISDGDVETYLNEHLEDYTLADYYRFNLNYDEASRLTVKEQADEMLGRLKTDGSNFDEVAQDYLAEGVTFIPCLNEGVSAQSIRSFGLDWLLEEGRTAGDRTVIEDSANSRWSVVLFLDRRLDDSYTVAVRHILLRTEADSDASAVEQQAKDLLAQWQAGEQTEDSFAQLAKEHSADGNAADGGLYTGVYRGQMVDTFNDWCFDPSRQPGDTGIVQTQYGYHVMYFVENEGVGYRASIRSTLESQGYNDWLTAASDGYATSFNRFGMAQV